MTNIDDVIDAINSTINATLVLHKKVVVHPKFKIYKIFSYDLYRIDSSTKELLLEWSTTKNASTEEISSIWRECDKEYLSTLVNWISSDSYKAMKK